MAKNLTGQYVIKLFNNQNHLVFFIIASTRKKAAALFAVLPTKKYSVIGMDGLYDVRDFDKFMHELIKGRKPKDLNYGKKGGER